jgi:hypothetical protein
MRAHFALALLAATSLAVSCNTEKADDKKDVQTEPAPNSVVESADGLTFYSPEFDIPPADSFTCIYTNYTTAKEWSVVGAAGVQGDGGHHLLVMYANDPRPVGVHTCTDDDMVNLTQIAGTAGKTNTQVLALPTGLAVKVPAGKQIVLQAHYINTTGATHSTRDWVKMSSIDPSLVKDYVNYFVTNDDGFEIPPNAPLQRTTTCAIDRDYQVALALPHMHELGQHFKLEVLDDQGAVIDTPLETDWQDSYTSHPPVKTWTMEAPYMLRKGQTLRQTCTWDNSSASPVIFPSEMCLAFFYYWPGQGDIDCEMKEVKP